MEPALGNRQQILVLSHGQGGDEMVRARLQRLEIGSGGIATIEHQRDIFAVLGQLLAAAEQRLGEAGEQRGVILVSRIRVGEQRNVVVAAHQECQVASDNQGENAATIKMRMPRRLAAL